MTSILKTAVCVAAMPVMGSASTLDAEQVLQQFNLITSGDVVTQQEVEGHAFIGGNLTGNTAQFDFKHADVPNDALASVVVLGDNSAMIKGQKGVNGTTFVIEGTNTGFVETANAAYVGSNSGRVQNVDLVVTGVGGTLPSSDLVPDESEVLGVLSAASVALSKLDATDTPTVTGQGYSFSGGIYNIDETYFGAGWPYEFVLEPEAGETTIINVSGTSIKLQENFVNTPYETAQNVLWNFYEATELFLDRTIIGSVLAPTAEVSVNASMEGTLFAQDVNLFGGEIHLQQFAGTLPGGSSVTDPGNTVAPSPVPVPAALPLLIAALGGLAFLRRKA